jgi:hypothetical protein
MDTTVDSSVVGYKLLAGHLPFLLDVLVMGVCVEHNTAERKNLYHVQVSRVETTITKGYRGRRTDRLLFNRLLLLGRRVLVILIVAVVLLLLLSIDLSVFLLLPLLGRLSSSFRFLGLLLGLLPYLLSNPFNRLNVLGAVPSCL